jgi:mRNA interferase YafQ
VDLSLQTRLQANEGNASPSRDVETLLPEIVGQLADDKPLKEKHRDHGLGGDWKGHRECHLKPDLLLIYKRPDQTTLRLVRMGSHSELFA